MLLASQPLQRRRVEGILAGPQRGEPGAGCLDHEGAKVARRSRSTKLTKVPAAARIFANFVLRALRDTSWLRDPNVPPPASPRRRDSRRPEESRAGRRAFGARSCEGSRRARSTKTPAAPPPPGCVGRAPGHCDRWRTRGRRWTKLC